MGGVVRSKNLRIAGDKFNNDIITYIRNQFKILIGEKTAENVKHTIGSVISGPVPLETTIKGRDLITGLPREVIVTDTDIREALYPSIETLVESTREVLELTPPEILSDIMQRGIYLAGGGALITGLAELIQNEVNIPVHVTADPLTAVARGTGIILENIELYKDILIENEDALPPKK